MRKLPLTAKIFIGLTACTGGAVLGNGLVHWKAADALQFLALLAVAIGASRLKVNLPGINGCMSVNLLFFLIAVAQLSLAEAAIIACVSSLIQSIWASSKQMRAVQVLFNSAVMTNAVAVAAVVFASLSTRREGLPLAMAAAGASFFLANTLPVAIVLWLAEEQSPLKTWLAIARLTFPYYLLSAGMAVAVCTAVTHIGWQIPLLLFPLVYFTYRSYQLYFSAPSRET
jgi:hypothetical protein